MPAGYASTARALELPVSPLSESASPRTPSRTNSHASNVPQWARHGARRNTASRRLSTPYSRPDKTPFGRRLLQYSISAMNKAVRFFNSLALLQKVLAVVVGLISIAISVLFLIYSHNIFAWLEPIAVGWRELPGGWLILLLMIFAAAFPPMVGYSTCLTISGFIYGFPNGWPVAALGTVLGSFAAFIASRTVLSRYVHSLVGSDKRFVAFGQVLRRDGILVLAAIRMCPLPYSLSNGFLSTIPSISPQGFAIATAMASPKLLIHVFIGSRMAKLAESGDDMSVGDKIINYASMIFGGLLGAGLGLFIYRRTMARANELMQEEGAENGEAGFLTAEFSGPGVDFADFEDAELRDPDELDAALMDADDISLWAADGVDDEAYRDDTDSANDQDSDGKYDDRGGSPHDVNHNTAGKSKVDIDSDGTIQGAK